MNGCTNFTGNVHTYIYICIYIYIHAHTPVNSHRWGKSTICTLWILFTGKPLFFPHLHISVYPRVVRRCACHNCKLTRYRAWVSRCSAVSDWIYLFWRRICGRYLTLGGIDYAYVYVHILYLKKISEYSSPSTTKNDDLINPKSTSSSPEFDIWISPTTHKDHVGFAWLRSASPHYIPLWFVLDTHPPQETWVCGEIKGC